MGFRPTRNGEVLAERLIRRDHNIFGLDVRYSLRDEISGMLRCNLQKKNLEFIFAMMNMDAEEPVGLGFDFVFPLQIRSGTLFPSHKRTHLLQERCRYDHQGCIAVVIPVWHVYGHRCDHLHGFP